MGKIKKIKEEVKSAIRRKSAYTLPNNPTDSGWKADDIRKAFWQPVLDGTNSALTEIDRVVEEVNVFLSHTATGLDNIESVAGSYYHSSTGLIYTLSEEGFSIVGYEGEELNLIIPTYVFYDKKYVKIVSIESEAFKEKKIESIEIPQTIFGIGNAAFISCEQLSEVVFYGKTEIGTNVFEKSSTKYVFPKEYSTDYKSSLLAYVVDADSQLIGVDTVGNNAKRLNDLEDQNTVKDATLSLHANKIQGLQNNDTLKQNQIDALEKTKQDALSFDGVYNQSTNKVATQQTVANEIAKIIANAPEDFDTLKEISDWLANHGKTVAEINSSISANASKLALSEKEIETINQKLGGAIVENISLIGVDENGGNVYQIVYQSGATFNFTAPKGKSMSTWALAGRITKAVSGDVHVTLYKDGVIYTEPAYLEVYVASGETAWRLHDKGTGAITNGTKSWSYGGTPDGISWKIDAYSDSSKSVFLANTTFTSGKWGEPGTGISKVEQTTTSDEDGGTNVVKVTLSDNTESTFEVKNGKRGATGAKVIKTELQGQDVNGGNIYLQTFDDGTTATFIAPKGVDGTDGQDGVGISSITTTTTTTSGGANTVKITLTDGTVKTFYVYNGQQGTAAEKYPVGFVFVSKTSTHPTSRGMAGTWEPIPAGHTIVGAGTGYTVGNTGGSEDAVVVAHNHFITVHSYVRNDVVASDYTGGATMYKDVVDVTGNPHTSIAGESGVGKNMPPYVAYYAWVRIL